VDLWSEDPTPENGAISFSGGMIADESVGVTKGNIFVAKFRALKPGKSIISLENGQLLAADGEGTNVIQRTKSISIFVREPNMPSPDVNGDGELTIGDVNSLYLKTFRNYDRNHDINADGNVNWSDVRELISLL
jgi:hypothetical protein